MELKKELEKVNNTKKGIKTASIFIAIITVIAIVVIAVAEKGTYLEFVGITIAVIGVLSLVLSTRIMGELSSAIESISKRIK